MSRKGIFNWPMFGKPGADLSADRISLVSDIRNQDNVGIYLAWSGTSPSGAVIIEASNDWDPTLISSGTWFPLDFGASISISGSSGSHQININQFPFTAVRARYSRTSGTGTLLALLTSKGMG